MDPLLSDGRSIWMSCGPTYCERPVMSAWALALIIQTIRSGQLQSSHFLGRH